MNIAICHRSSEAAGILGLQGSAVDLVVYKGKKQVVVLARTDFPPERLLDVKGIRKADAGFHPSRLPAYLFRGATTDGVSRKLQRHFPPPMAKAGE